MDSGSLIALKIAHGLDEATIMGLGIFEDTGGFTFNSTTEHDFEG